MLKPELVCAEIEKKRREGQREKREKEREKGVGGEERKKE